MRKILLLICLVFTVVSFAYPNYVLPFGSYTYEYTIAGEKNKASYEFKFNGEVNFKATEKSDPDKLFYKLKGNEIIISADKTFDDNDQHIRIDSVFKFENFRNDIAMWISIGVGIFTLVLIITIPRKR